MTSCKPELVHCSVLFIFALNYVIMDFPVRFQMEKYKSLVPEKECGRRSNGKYFAMLLLSLDFGLKHRKLSPDMRCFSEVILSTYQSNVLQMYTLFFRISFSAMVTATLQSFTFANGKHLGRPLKHLFCPHPTAVYTRLKHDMMESKKGPEKNLMKSNPLFQAKTNMAPPIIKLALLTRSWKIMRPGEVMTLLCL